MDKEFAEKLKQDMELKVTGSPEEENASASSEFGENLSVGAGSTEAEAPVAAPFNPSQSNESGKSESSEPSKRADDLKEKTKIAAVKRANEQEFLASYKKKVFRSRMIFVVAALTIFILIRSLFIYAFGLNPSGTSGFSTTSKLTPTTLFAALGERDFAYGLMSSFSGWTGTEDSPELFKRRTNNMNRAIEELDKSGHPAILARLGAEAMQIKFGDREEGLKIGNVLIQKYPDLPSPFFYRARIDLERHDFANTIKDENEALAVLNRLKPADAKGWSQEITKGVLASIFSGNFSQANHFIDAFTQYGGGKTESTTYKVTALLELVKALSITDLQKSDLSSPEINKFAADTTKDAIELTKTLPYYFFDEEGGYNDRDHFMLDSTLLAGDTSYAQKQAEYVYDSELLKGRIKLAQNKPNEAIDHLLRSKYYASVFDKHSMLAAAYNMTGRYAQALTEAESAAGYYYRDEMKGSKFFNLKLSAAEAQLGLGETDKALLACDQVLQINPTLVKAHILKMKILEKAGRHTEAIAEGEKVKQTVEKLLQIRKELKF